MVLRLEIFRWVLQADFFRGVAAWTGHGSAMLDVEGEHATERGAWGPGPPALWVGPVLHPLVQESPPVA